MLALTATLLFVSTAPSCGQTVTSSSTPTVSSTVVKVDPAWTRSVNYFLAAFPYFTHYSQDTQRSFTWTSDTWNGPSAGEGGNISGWVPGDYWFATRDYGDGTQATYYWFKTQVTVTNANAVLGLKLEDKYHPGRLTLNDGLIVFINGVPLSCVTPTVSQAHPLKPWFGTGWAYKPLEYPSTGWSMNALSLPANTLREGTNEIAVLYGERNAIGGIGHLVLELTYQ